MVAGSKHVAFIVKEIENADEILKARNAHIGEMFRLLFRKTTEATTTSIA